ncbi:MAG: hypothetical protein HYT89_03545 [Candidatus Omnitrophica bacterium]|nr:hypothetical protein [Candidatus Omnitrophota bacterium]
MGSFCFIDKVAEVKRDQSVTAFFELKGNEEFLKDHFSEFPVMPGVLLLEVLKQAACVLLGQGGGGNGHSLYRLSEAGAVKFGKFVRPGSTLKAFVRLVRKEKTSYCFEGRLDLERDGSPEGKALSAEFQLVPV